MPSYEITGPDGKTYEVTAPQGATQEQVLQYVQAQHAPQPAPQAAPQATPQPEESFGQAIGSQMRGLRAGLHRIPQSGAELVARGTDAVGLSKGAYPMLHEMFTKDNASYMGDSKHAKFGDVAGQIAGTLPAMGLRAPALLSKLPTASRIATGAAQGIAGAGMTSSASDAPLSSQLAMGAAFGGGLPLLAAGAKLGGNAAAGVLGQVTGAGGASIRNAFNAGKAGGEASKAFTSSMRDPKAWGQVVEDAKGAIGKMKAERSQAYKSGMVDISKDATVLDFKPIDEAIGKAASVKNFKGKDLSPKTAGVRKELDDAIQEWRALDPKEYHTPEGMDALKQVIGDIRDSIPFEREADRLIANNAYNAVKSAIVKQAPAYAKVMDDYSVASEELAALTKELSLGPKGNPNTALRKLQSVMRDNANTSWGDRAKYADRLSEAGARNLMPSLAGQALSTPVPRGLTKFADGAALLAASAHNPLLLAGAGFASPRLMGEAAHGLGAATRGATNITNKIPLRLPALSPVFGGMAPQLLLAGKE